MQRTAVFVAAATLLLAAASVHATTTSVDVSFSGNVTVHNSTQSGTLSFRKVEYVSITSVAFGILLTEASSLVVTSGNATFDLIVAGFLSFPLSFPTSFAYYFEDQSSWTRPEGTVSFLADLVSASSGSGGVVGLTYLTLQEFTPSGTLQATINLNAGILSFDTSVTGSYVDSTGNLKYNWAAYSGFAGQSNLVVNFTFIHSQVLGELTLGATLTPKSTDTIVSIAGYNYNDAANNLRLTYSLGYGVFNYESSGTIQIDQINTGSAPNSAFISTSTQAQVDGSLTSATVNIVSQTSLTAEQGSLNINALVGAVATGSKNFAIVTVDFAANAGTINYDPTSGFEPLASAAGLANGALARASGLFAVVLSIVVVAFGMF